MAVTEEPCLSEQLPANRIVTDERFFPRNHVVARVRSHARQHVLDSSWPPRLRVVLVDNASEDGVVARVRAELPAVEVLENLENVGFGAGCNRGIRAAGDVDYVALVNNDATVEPGWLRPLVAALETDPGVGAACPKILFAGRYRDLELRSATTAPRSG